MREIKFRAWSRSNKTLLGVMNIDFNMELVTVRDLMSPQNIQFMDCVLEQYTGLKDKNSKEIYEGDIIKYFGANKRVKVKTTYGIVFYDSEHGCFNSRIQNGEHGKGGISLANDLVIGNIHENADLLEEK